MVKLGGRPRSQNIERRSRETRKRKPLEKVPTGSIDDIETFFASREERALDKGRVTASDGRAPPSSTKSLARSADARSKLSHSFPAQSLTIINADQLRNTWYTLQQFRLGDTPLAPFKLRKGVTGRDVIMGFRGSDKLRGGAGDDTLGTGRRTLAPWLPSTSLEGETTEAALAITPRLGDTEGMSEADMRLLAYTLLGEAEGEGPAGMLAVANVIRNRAESPLFPNSPVAVVLDPGQFVTNDPKKGNQTAVRRRNPVGSDLFNTALRIVDSVFVKGNAPDATGKALFYHTLDVNPNWSNGVKTQYGTHDIGAHRFYPREPIEASAIEAINAVLGTSGAFEDYYQRVKGEANYFSTGRNDPGGDPSTAAWQSANLVTVTAQTVDGPKPVRVYGPAAQAYQGFLDDLAATGYEIHTIEGANYRMKGSGTSLSEHSFGTAIDINGLTLPGEEGPRNAMAEELITDLPDDVSRIAAKWGLSWGGDWGSVKDAMHFEYTGIAPFEGLVPPANIGVSETLVATELSTEEALFQWVEGVGFVMEGGLQRVMPPAPRRDPRGVVQPPLPRRDPRTGLLTGGAGTNTLGVGRTGTIPREPILVEGRGIRRRIQELREETRLQRLMAEAGVPAQPDQSPRPAALPFLTGSGRAMYGDMTQTALAVTPELRGDSVTINTASLWRESLNSGDIMGRVGLDDRGLGSLLGRRYPLRKPPPSDGSGSDVAVRDLREETRLQQLAERARPRAGDSPETIRAKTSLRLSLALTMSPPPPAFPPRDVLPPREAPAPSSQPRGPLRRGKPTRTRAAAKEPALKGRSADSNLLDARREQQAMRFRSAYRVPPSRAVDLPPRVAAAVTRYPTAPEIKVTGTTVATDPMAAAPRGPGGRGRKPKPVSRDVAPIPAIPSDVVVRSRTPLPKPAPLNPPRPVGTPPKTGTFAPDPAPKLGRLLAEEEFGDIGRQFDEAFNDVPAAQPRKTTTRRTAAADPYVKPKPGDPTPIADLIEIVNEPGLVRLGKMNTDQVTRVKEGRRLRGYPFVRWFLGTDRPRSGAGSIFGGRTFNTESNRWMPTSNDTYSGASRPGGIRSYYESIGREPPGGYGGSEYYSSTGISRFEYADPRSL